MIVVDGIPMNSIYLKITSNIEVCDSFIPKFTTDDVELLTIIGTIYMFSK